MTDALDRTKILNVAVAEKTAVPLLQELPWSACSSAFSFGDCDRRLGVHAGVHGFFVPHGRPMSWMNFIFLCWHLSH